MRGGSTSLLGLFHGLLPIVIKYVAIFKTALGGESQASTPWVAMCDSRACSLVCCLTNRGQLYFECAGHDDFLVEQSGPRLQPLEWLLVLLPAWLAASTHIIFVSLFID